MNSGLGSSVETGKLVCNIEIGGHKITRDKVIIMKKHYSERERLGRQGSIILLERGKRRDLIAVSKKLM